MAKLPNASAAEIPIRKVRDYLLSTTHPVGRFKAAFFQALGFEVRRSGELVAAILQLAQSEDAIPGNHTRYGKKYVVRGTIDGPNGLSSEIETVWIVLNSESHARFITAYPGD